MIGFMQFQMVFALISKNKIERHANEVGSATCLSYVALVFPFTIMARVRVQPLRVSIYIHEFLFKSNLTHIP